MENRAQLINTCMTLFSIAISDNELDPSELNYLYEFGLTNGLSKDEIDNLIANPHKARFSKPTNILDAISQLYDIVEMVLKDGKIHPHEVDLCRSFARKFEFREEIIDELIESLIDEFRSGRSKTELIDEISKNI